jgi:ubiquinone/menaquinone biosynthesis C-methylase UbiE
LLVPKRIDEPELLDEHDAPHDAMERSLRDLRRFNSLYGGASVYRRLLRRVAPAPRSILDIATGTADSIESVPGFRVGVDFKIGHLLYMRNGSQVHRVVADALRLPFRDNAFDVVTSAHFFHHLTPDENRRMLRDALRIGRRCVIVNDTLRHYIPYLFVRLLGLLRLVGPITRNDAPASVLRGYTIDEVRAIAKESGAGRFDVVRAWPFRFGLFLWKST